MRDIFGSMLFLSLEQRIDMGEILKYSQTQVTFSVANVDGSKKKKKKKAIRGTGVTRCMC